MGLYDTVWVELECPNCKRRALRDVQFKHDEHTLSNYMMGDYVEGLPAGQLALRGIFGCPCGPEREVLGPNRIVKLPSETFTACWVHFDNGFITAVTLERPVQPQSLTPELLHRIGERTRRERVALESIWRYCRARQGILEEGYPEEKDFARIFERIWGTRTEQELLQKILKAAEELFPWMHQEE